MLASFGFRILEIKFQFYLDAPNDLKVFSSRCNFDLFTNNLRKQHSYDNQTFQNQSKHEKHTTTM